MKLGAWFWALVLAGIAALVVTFFVFLPEPQAPVTLTERTAAPDNRTPATSPGVSFVDDAPPSARTTLLPDAPSGITDGAAWEDKLDNILGSDADEATATRQLLAALPGLPPEAQEEYIAHALNLCADEQFAEVQAIYLSSSTPGAVTEAIFDDALNRPDELKLPLMARSLGRPAHPMREETIEILEMYLDLDPGQTPPEGWEAAVQKYLREEAAAEQSP